MKTNLFNFRRVGLLFQRYFIERFRTELIYWCIMAIVFMFLRNNLSAMTALIFIAGVFYAARFFKEIHHSGNGVAYFMIPATQLEKLTVAIVMTTLYYFAMMIVVYVIGNLSGTFLGNMLATMDFLPNALIHQSSLQWKLFDESGLIPLVTFDFTNSDIENVRITGRLFTTFLLNQSLFLFGSIYFKRSQAFKTFSATILICILLAILIQIEARLILGDVYFSGANMAITQKTELAIWLRKFVDAAKIIFFLLPLYFWIVSYFRLTEKQV